MKMNSARWLMEPRRWEVVNRDQPSDTVMKKKKYQAPPTHLMRQSQKGPDVDALDPILEKIREKMHKKRNEWLVNRESKSLKKLKNNTGVVKETCKALTKSGKRCSFSVSCGDFCRKHST